MRTLIATMLLAGCASQTISDPEYDEVARIVGATITMPEKGGGGDVGAAADSALLALGETPAGLVDHGWMATGTRAGLDVVYMPMCTDAAGAPLLRCGPSAAMATIIGHWSGSFTSGELAGTIQRDGSWTLTGMATGAAALTGTADFELDASFASSARYHITVSETAALQLDMALDAVVGGTLASTIVADRTIDASHGTQQWHDEIAAEVTFPDQMHATLVLDGSHVYDLVIVFIR